MTQKIKVYNLRQGPRKDLFNDYSFIKSNNQHWDAVLKSGVTEPPSVLWGGNATLLQDILSLYSFFARQLVCLEKEYGEDNYFYRPPGKKGIKFTDPWKKTSHALKTILQWKPKDKQKFQNKIIAFHYLRAYRNERLLYVKSAIMRTCLVDCLKNELGKDIWEKFLGISKEEYNFILKCWIRLRNCNVHKISFQYQDFIADKAEDKYQILTANEIGVFKKCIKDEKDFNQFIKDSLWAFDVLLTYYYANIFGCLKLKQAPSIQDKHYLLLKNYFQTLKSSNSVNYPIWQGKK
ncbi:MAG: hypothetical protein KC900_12865 [Candidatus Omnitrophica bacterium]|nr:hypothetical protein [Candidatus Omnitrophota bacterium]